MTNSNNPILWENEDFKIITPTNPHLPYSEGAHLIISPKNEFQAAWENPELAAKTFELAAKVCAILEKEQFAPWFNIQANGNWGLLPGATPWFHIHLYCRNITDRWAKPIILPEAPKTYQNEPMPEADSIKLTAWFDEGLVK